MGDPPPPAPTLRRSRRQPLLPSTSFIRAMRSRFGLFNECKQPAPAPSKPSMTPSTFRSRRPSHLSSGAFILPSPALPPDHIVPTPKLSTGVFTPADLSAVRQRSRPSLKRLIPIHTLPSELLIHVFAIGTLMDPMFVVTASQVCGLWRELALQTPTLWRTLTLDGRTEMWARRLARARGCTLDVRLAHAPFMSKRRRRRMSVEWAHFGVQSALHPAIAHLPRWRTLSLCFDRPSPFLWNAALSPLCLPGAHALALTSLELVYPENDDSKHFALFSGYAPRLRHATLSGVRLVWDHGLFGNLVSLDYSHPSFTAGPLALAEVLGMLRVSTHLEELSLSFLPPNSDMPPIMDTEFVANAFHPVTLPRLRVLELSVLARPVQDELPITAAYIIAPALHTLRLRDRTRSPRAFALDITVWPGLHAVRHLSVEHGWACRRHIFDAARVMRALHLVEVVGRGGAPVQIRVPVGEERHTKRWLIREGVGWIK